MGILVGRSGPAGPVRRGLPSSEQGLVRMAVRRTNSRGWVLPTRVLAIAGLLALLAAGCGQIGGTHGSTGGTVPAAYVAPDARPPAGQTPDFVAGPSISGNTSTLGSGHGTTTRTVTVTQ